MEGFSFFITLPLDIGKYLRRAPRRRVLYLAETLDQLQLHLGRRGLVRPGLLGRPAGVLQGSVEHGLHGGDGPVEGGREGTAGPGQPGGRQGGEEVAGADKRHRQFGDTGLKNPQKNNRKYSTKQYNHVTI